MARLRLTLSYYEDAMDQLYNEVAYALHMGDEILSMFPPIKVSHRCKARIVSTPKVFDSTMKPLRAKEKAHVEMFLDTDSLKFRDLLLGLNKSIQDQLKMQTWDTIFKTAEAAGHSIDGKGRNFWNVYIETLQKIDFKFDQQGRHNYRFYMNSETAKSVMAVPPTDDQLRRAKEVMDAKQEAFLTKKKRLRRLSSI
jgi:hypothetical protein